MNNDRAVLIVLILGSAAVVVITAFIVFDATAIPRVPQEVPPVIGARP